MSDTTNEQQIIKRDKLGLIEGKEYKFKKDGTIDWKAMIPHEFLYVQNSGFDTNPEEVEKMTKKYGKHPRELKVTEVEDRHLAILLQGIRYIANLRGFIEDDRIVNSITFDKNYDLTSGCTVTSKIRWIGNFETNFLEVVTTDIAGASSGNVDKFMKKYVETAASNRAFIRNVRAFLNIGIVGKDEIAPFGELKPARSDDENNASPISNEAFAILELKVRSLGLNFKQFKKHAQKYFNEGLLTNDPSAWEGYNDIDATSAYMLLSKISEKEQKTG